MKTRKTYHSSIKLAYALGLQDTWLPRSFTETIPRSTFHAWKSQAKEKYVGYQFAHHINSNVEELKMTYHQRLERERQLFMAYARIKLTADRQALFLRKCGFSTARFGFVFTLT